MAVVGYDDPIPKPDLSQPVRVTSVGRESVIMNHHRKTRGPE
jgi:hypothetical protein